MLFFDVALQEHEETLTQQHIKEVEEAESEHALQSCVCYFKYVSGATVSPATSPEPMCKEEEVAEHLQRGRARASGAVKRPYVV